MEVTRSNFQDMLPAVQQALRECRFFAIDCEMTGLFMEERPGDLYDLIQDRYEQMRTSSRNFVISQWGLSAFCWERGTWTARTFNFWVFPHAFEDFNRRFVCEASAMTFLAEQGFDFNRFIKEGVPCMPAQLRDAKLAEVGQPRDSNEIIVRKEEDREFVAQLVHQVTTWLKGRERQLDLAPTRNRFYRAIMYQQLEKHQFGAKEPPGFYVEKVEQEEGPPFLRLTRATPDEVAAFQERQRQAKVDEIMAASAFSQVLEAARDSGKPCVGHNCMFDLAYSLESFAEPLPPTWPEFKALAAAWLPGGVYDTKHLARLLPGLFLEGGTSLGVDLYPMLMQGMDHPDTKAFIDALGHPGQMGFYPVSHAPQHQKYAGEGAMQFYHEAGYDAFMTGAVFTRLLLLHQMQAAANGGPRLGVGSPELDAVLGMRGRINLTRTDLPYAALSGEDVVPDRAHVLHARGLPEGAQTSDLLRPFDELQLGGVRVTWLGDRTECFLELYEPAEVAKVVSTFGSTVGVVVKGVHHTVRLQPYSQWRASLGGNGVAAQRDSQGAKRLKVVQ